MDQKKALELKAVPLYTPSSAVLALELDELWTFVFRKANPAWLWVALERSTSKVVAWTLGDRSEATFFKLWDAVPGLGAGKLAHGFATDAYPVYGAIPEERRTTRAGQTNRVERFFGTARQRLARLVRKTLSFSKSVEMLEAALTVFMHSHNASR